MLCGCANIITKGGERKMNRKFKAAAWAVLLILFVFSGAIVHAQDETMSTNTPGSINEEASKEAIIEEGGKSVEVLFDASKDLVKEAVQAGAANEGDKNAEGNGEQAEAPAEKDAQGQTGDQAAEPEANAEGEAEIKPVDPEAIPAEGEQADSEVKTAEGNETPTENSETPQTEGQDPTGENKTEPVGEEKPEGEGASEGSNTGANQPAPAEGEGKKESKPEVDTSVVPELSELQKQIDEAEKAKDDKKAAELKKQYADKLFKNIEETGADKLNSEVLKRFTDAPRTKEFYEIQAEYEALKKKAEEGKLTKEEVDAFNNKVGSFKPPRKLDADEESAQKKLADSVDVPRVKEDSTDPKAQEKLDAYKKAKEALKKALDADKTEGKAEKLAELVKTFEDAEAALKSGINDGSIKPTYTDGSPKVRVFPLVNGSVGEELKQDPANNDNPYYIPDNTSIELLVHVNKDDEPKEFTFKIKAIGEGVEDPNGQASNLAFLNGNPVDLVRNEDGSYTFKVSAKDMNFGIAQLRFNIPGFEGPFHKGFDLEMDLGKDKDGKEIKVTKQFRITKKGYEDEAHLNGPGSDSADDPTKIPEVDAGDTENAKVKEDSAKEVLDFFTYLKKSNTYIDNVTFNSGNGESLPLDSVDITITVPKFGENNFAKMIHKSGLEYHDLGDGRYQLKLDRKVFGGNLVKEGDKLYLTDENGKKTDKELTKATITDAILENAGKKVYVDKEENVYDIITSEVLEKDGYKVENGKLYKKNDEDQNKFDEIGTFDKTGKIEKDGKIYVLKDNKLISYTKEYDVYEGNVVNKDGKADPNVTPTYEGRQVTVETTKDDKIEKSYGGTIVKDAIYDKNGKFFNKAGYTGKTGKILINADGTEASGIDFDEKQAKVDKNTGVKIITINNKTYHIVENPVFKNEYIIDGLEYKEGLSLIDKFGKKMNVKVTEKEGTYTFTKILKDKEGNEIEDEDKVESGENTEKKRKVIVGPEDNKQILVNNKNEVVNDPDENYKKIGPKYYYDGKEFVKAEGDGLQGNKFFVGFKELQLDPIVKHYYKVGDKNTEIKDFDKKSVYEGSLNPDDYFKVDKEIYVKKSQGAGSTAADYYVSADPKASDEILSEKKIAKIVQTLGEGKNAIEKVTKETDIFDAVQNAKFALKFPGFLAGKNIVYNVHADVKATYKKPNPKTGEFEEQSIFTEDDGIKKIDKFFTLKNEKTTNTRFFKNAPDALTKDPAVNLHFFNIFYRKADDRQRDQLIADLLEIEAEVKGKEAEVNKAEEAIETAKDDEAKKTAQAKYDKLKKVYDKLVKDNKEKLALIEKFKSELGRVKTGAKFIIKVDEKADQTNGPVYVKNDKGKTKLFIVDKDGKEIQADELNKMRSLLWEVGFNNTEGTLFPENPDTEIIIEDHNMDNRLIYDEIIVNDTKENWDNLNKAHEEAEKKVAAAEKALKENEDESQKDNLSKALEEAKKALEKAEFKGTKEYFFLDQIKDIRFGVSPNYIDGRFVPLGEDFKITGQEIIKKLKDNPNEKSVVIEKGKGENKIKFLVTRDTVNGQIRIKVMNAFYAKGEEGSKNKFESPVQKVYQDKITNLFNEVDKLSEKTTKKDIEGIVKALHDESSECFGIIKEKLTKEFDSVRTNKDELKTFKEKLEAEIEKIKLAYLDSSKGEYKYDDMRFNAIRIGLNPNITIGGAMNPENKKMIGISSVIVPEIDIPYTDEFGNPLTNKDMYVKAEIEKILKDGIGEGKDKKTYKENDLKNEEKFREIMAEAYKRVNDNKEIEIKDLVIIDKDNQDKVGMEKYTVANGSDLKLGDLAVDGKVLTNKEGFAINPWYIVKGKETKSVEEIFKEKFGAGYDKMPEYLELEKMHIDIAAYYMSKQGYDRSKYANQANYKLSGGDKKDGIFGSDSDWHKKICYPGIGHCIEQAGKNPKPGENPDQGKFGAEEEIGADFELTYEPTNKGPEKEEPKVDKKTEGKDKIDLSNEEGNKTVDFTISVTVDKMTKKQKDIADALTPERPEKPKKLEAEMTEEEKKAAEAEKEAKKIEAGNYNTKTGYYEYKNSLIIDFLPEIFKLKEDQTTLTLNVDRKKLMENGANSDFKDDKKYEEWKNGIKYFYTDDLLAYAETLTDKEKAEVLKKAIEDAKASGKIKEGQKVQAVIAWVPTFEAPHGSKEQFKFELKNVYVDKKKFKDFDDEVIGTNYTNHAAFGDKARFYFGETTVNIYEQHEGKVNKYLQLLEKDGKTIIDADKAEGWFKGNAELKFGDKFKYRIEYHNNTGVVAVPGEANNKSEIKLEDVFATVDKKGLRPVLNGFIESDFDFENQYKVTYKIGKDEYTKEKLEEAIKENKAKLSDVTSVVLEGKYKNGASHNFYIPMMIPEIDAKIKDGKVSYIGTDGEKHELGDAKDFFNLGYLTEKDKNLIAENKVKDSNTVTVYLEKERFIKVFKEFLKADGETLITEGRPEIKFDVYQILTDKDGKKIRVKLKDQLVVNEKNNFEDKLDHLPIFKKITTIDEKGNVKVKEVNYEYKLEEVVPAGYEAKVFEIKDDDGLGFVWKATNTEKPTTPPGEEPKEVTVTIKVNKVWKVLNGGSTPSIQVELYANGKATGKIITLGDGNWSASFKDLPAKDKDGKKIIYTVREVGEADYITEIDDRKFEVSYEGDIKNGFTITNEEVPPEEPEEPDEEEPDEPDEPETPETPEDEGGGKNVIPKTGVRTDLGSIFFSGILLLALFFFKRKFFKN